MSSSSILSKSQRSGDCIEGCGSGNASKQSRTLRYALHVVSRYSGCYRLIFSELRIIGLGSELRAFVRQRKLGWITGGEVGIYTRRNPDRVRGGDVVFISKERMADKPPGKGFLEIAPDLGRSEKIIVPKFAETP